MRPPVGDAPDRGHSTDFAGGGVTGRRGTSSRSRVSDFEPGSVPDESAVATNGARHTVDATSVGVLRDEPCRVAYVVSDLASYAGGITFLQDLVGALEGVDATVWNVGRAREAIVADVRDAGATVANLGHRGRVAKLTMATLVDLLGNLDNDVDVVHGWTMYTNVLTRLARSALDAAVVAQAHFDPSHAGLQPRVWADVATTRLSDVTVAASESVRHTLYGSRGSLRQRLVGGDVRVIHNGVDVADVRSVAAATPGREAYDVPADADLLVNVGNMTRSKNQQTLLEAFAATDVPGSHLVVVGDGPQREALVQTAASLGIDTDVTFTGNVARERALALVADAALFVSPSRHEALPISVLEAFALDRPTVLSDIPAHREVGDRATSVFVPPTSTRGYASAFRALLADRSRCREIGAAARRRAETSFDIEETARAYERLYAEVAR